jgi:hypothetical protein
MGTASIHSAIPLLVGISDAGHVDPAGLGPLSKSRDSSACAKATADKKELTPRSPARVPSVALDEIYAFEEAHE